MVNFKRVIFLLICISVAGCATVINSQKQKINITTICNKNYIPAYCVAQTENHQMEFLTPGAISVDRSSSPIRIMCESSISESYGAWIKPYPSVAFFANWGAGGVSGMALDAINNSMWQYQSNVTIEIPWCPSKGKS